MSMNLEDEKFSKSFGDLVVVSTNSPLYVWRAGVRAVLAVRFYEALLLCLA